MQIEVTMKRTQYASVVVDWEDGEGFEPLYSHPDTIAESVIALGWDSPRTLYEVLAVEPVPAATAPKGTN